MTARETRTDPAEAAGRAEQAEAGAESHTEVYVISVAADLAGMHAQTLRNYDRLGLVTPQRTRGGGRRYSPRDVALLREIQRLSQEEGVNLAGIKRILELQREVAELREHIFHLHNELNAARSAVARRATSARPSGSGGELIPVHRTRVTIFNHTTTQPPETQ